MSVNCCLRWLLTVLHALTGLVAGFICLYSLIGWDYQTTCLPRLVDKYGGPLTLLNSLLEACDGFVYGMAVVCLLNFAMCLFINCLWQNACIAFINLLLNIIYIVFSVMGGTTFAVYYIIWCDSLERIFPGSHGCQSAAEKYEQLNSTEPMSQYKIRMEVQMASLFSLCPIACLAVLAYALTLRIFAKPDARDGRFRYVIMTEETTPLLNSNNTITNNSHPASRTNSLPNGTSGSTNPFDN